MGVILRDIRTKTGWYAVSKNDGTTLTLAEVLKGFTKKETWMWCSMNICCVHCSNRESGLARMVHDSLIWIANGTVMDHKKTLVDVAWGIGTTGNTEVRRILRLWLIEYGYGLLTLVLYDSYCMMRSLTRNVLLINLLNGLFLYEPVERISTVLRSRRRITEPAGSSILQTW